TRNRPAASSRDPASAAMTWTERYSPRAARGSAARLNAKAQQATVPHWAAITGLTRREPGIAAKQSGAAAGNNPTGPFVRAAAAMHPPETMPYPSAAAVDLALTAASAASMAAVVNTATVVSSRLPTMAQETTGTAIQRRTGHHHSGA